MEKSQKEKLISYEQLIGEMFSEELKNKENNILFQDNGALIANDQDSNEDYLMTSNDSNATTLMCLKNANESEEINAKSNRRSHLGQFNESHSAKVRNQTAKRQFTSIVKQVNQSTKCTVVISII